jgi:hypothetical protein
LRFHGANTPQEADMHNTPLRFVPLLAAALLASGCASLSLPSHDDLQVVTDPPGAIATCGNASTVTPGTLRIPREKSPSVTVRVEMEGYESREIQIARNRKVPMSPWGYGFGLVGAAAWAGQQCEEMNWPDCRDAAAATGVTAAIVSLAGLAIDSASPRTHPLPRKELVLRLEPVRLEEAPKGALR